MGAYFSLSKKLDRINANIENRVSEIVSVTAFADSICKEYREEIRAKEKLLDQYKETIEAQRAIITRLRTQPQKKHR